MWYVENFCVEGIVILLQASAKCLGQLGYGIAIMFCENVHNATAKRIQMDSFAINSNIDHQ